MTVDPQPGDWVLIRAKVLSRPTPENVEVELFSATDQYGALVRVDRCEITDKPIPEEPPVDSVALVNNEAFQRTLRGWVGIGHERSFTWSSLAGGPSDVEVIHHG